MLWAQIFYLVLMLLFTMSYLIRSRVDLVLGACVGIGWGILAGCIDQLSNCNGSYGWQVSLLCFQLLGLIVVDSKMNVIIRSLLILLAGGFDLVLGWPL